VIWASSAVLWLIATYSDSVGRAHIDSERGPYVPSSAVPQPADDSADAIGAVVRRLARPHASGGSVIERSVIIAEGSGSAAILGWIADHHGVADSTAGASSARSGGLHGARLSAAVGRDDAPARRFVLPADAFDSAG
jgi:hypothetical protein